MTIAIIRTIVLYLFIILGIRLLGKRQIGELEPTEFVFALIIADLAAVPMQDYGIPLLAGIVPIMTLLCLASVISVLNLKSVRLRNLLDGTPSILVENGKIRQREMTKNRCTVDELLEELRLKGYPDIGMVKYAIWETNGQLTVLPYAKEQPVPAKDLQLSPADPTLPRIIINDGQVLHQTLQKRGLDDVWLQKQLASSGVKSPKEVFLMTVDDNNQVYCSVKETNV
ncbi:MAG: hypothetical protein H6Q60_628 [Oscillospiraceae bacterium]|nr:hypothetical protein [Oscillospiraceae bacterium]